MPYASSIQIVNDANGAAYAFLEDDGFLWQCQWNAEAQRWDKGQVVPGAYGGQNLQVLEVNNLWPTYNNSGSVNKNPVTPGIVLAYQVGEGDAAKVYGTIGRWGSDGRLSWSASLLLSDSGSTTEQITLAPDTNGGFNVVCQVRQPLAAGEVSTPAAARTDSELMQRSFALSGSDADGFSLQETTNGTSNGTSQPVTLIAQPRTIATPSLATAGNTQFSREALTLAPAQGIQGLRTGTTEGPLASPSAQAPTGWSGGLGLKFKNGSGNFKLTFGALAGQTPTRWSIQTPLSGPPIDWSKGGRKNISEEIASETKSRSFFQGELGKVDLTTEDAIGQINMLITIIDNSSERIRIFEETKRDLTGKLEGEGNSSSTNYNILSGTFGFGGYGSQSVQSNFGYTYNPERSKSWGNVGDAYSNTDYFSPMKQVRKNWLFIFNAQSTYNFSNLNPFSSSFGLKKISQFASASIGYYYDRRQRLETGGYFSFRVQASVGLAQSGNVVNSQTDQQLPEWLQWLGYGSGALGAIEGNLLMGAAYKKQETIIENLNVIKDQRRRGTAGKAFNSVNAGLGIAQTILPDFALFSPNIDYSNARWGFVEKGSIGGRYLYKGVAGGYANLNDQATQLWSFKPSAPSAGFEWSNTLKFDAGLAFPFGVSVPVLSFSWSIPKPKPRSLGAGLPDSTSSNTPLLYTPAAGSTLLPNSSDQGSVPVEGGQSTLNLVTLNGYSSTVVTPDQATKLTPVVLQNAGAGLVDGTYTHIHVLGVQLPGSLPATLSFTVENGAVVANTVQIDGSGQYLQLPQTTDSSGVYALIPDVFSTGILPNPVNPSSSSFSSLLQQLPLITVDSTRTGSPLATATIAAIPQTFPLTSASSNSVGLYANASPSDNSLVTYSAVPITVSSDTTSITLLNQTTATVGISNGSIVSVQLDDPLYFSFSGRAEPVSITVDLQSILGSDAPANPIYSVQPQTLGSNNVAEDQSYSSNTGFPANSQLPYPSTTHAKAVWLEDGINSQWQASPAQASWPVFNRVVVQSSDGSLAYLNASTTTANGEIIQKTQKPSDLTLQALYTDLTGSIPVPSFSAASTPTVVTLHSNRWSDAVFWVEASAPVVPKVSTDDSQNYQAFMQALYGQQRINYRIWDNQINDWGAPNTLDLYDPGQAVIRNLRAFNVQVGTTTQTLLVWDETSIATIEGTPPPQTSINAWITGTTLQLSGSSTGLQIGDLISGQGVKKGTLITGTLAKFDPTTGTATYSVSRNQSVGSSSQPAALIATTLLPPSELKAGFINPTATNLQWSSLFKDASDNSTIITIPWEETDHIGLGIESITVASQQVVDPASGTVNNLPVLSWSENVRTPYQQSVLNDQPLIYLLFGALQPGSNDINIGSVPSNTSTATEASSTGLNFTIASALPKSGASAVQNIDGTGVLSTGTASQNALFIQAVNNTPTNQLPASPYGQMTASISGTTLTVTALNGSLSTGDLLTGPSVLPNTQISAYIDVDPTSGLGTYALNQSQVLASSTLEAVAIPAPRSGTDLGFPYSSFSGSINDTILTVSQLNGSLGVGDWIEGQGVTPGTQITSVLSVDPATGNGTYTLNQGQSLATSALVATPDSSIPYTIEFWTKLPAGSNAAHGAGLVAFGQPSPQAVGPAVAPSGWLMTANFSVQRISYKEAAAQGTQDAYDKLNSETAQPQDLYGWAWSLDATGANTTALGGNGGNNLYSNALNISNLYSGATLTGVDAFLSQYKLKASDLVGGDGLFANTIDLVPGTSLDFNHSLDPSTNQPVSNLNAVSIDTSASQLNSGLVQTINRQGDLSSDSTTNTNLQNMFQALWNYQQQYGESKIGFTLAPTETPQPESGFEQYGGYELDFVVASGPAISVNSQGQLVFDVSPDVSITSAATNPTGILQSPLPADLRDGEWHYVVATYLPNYKPYTINGEATQVPTNQGTASLYVDNQLVASASNVNNAYVATNPNDTALLLPNNAGGAIDQFALYDTALLPEAPLALNANGDWPEMTRADASAIFAQLGYSPTPDNANPGTIVSAISEHWRSRDVNPNAAQLATFNSTFSPSGGDPLQGSWSQAAPLNPIPAPEPTLPSATAPSLQNDLLIQIPSTAWATDGNWLVGANPTSATAFNPAGEQLKSISVSLSPFNADGSVDTSTKITRTLTPEQVLMGENSLASLQPRASTTDLNYTLLSATPALNLLISRNNNTPDDKSDDLDLSTRYSASVTLTFADGSRVSNNCQEPDGDGLCLSVNGDGAQVFTDFQTATKLKDNDPLDNRSNALATAEVIEAAPLQLKYVYSGEVLTSSSSIASANSPATPAPATSFGQSQAYGWCPSIFETNQYSGWLAIAQPNSSNAISNPAGRVWIQYGGDFIFDTTTNAHKAVSNDAAHAPITWLNALANSNFSPEAPNRPLLNDATYQASYGGLLIEADPTAGWGQDFAQTMLAVDIDGDEVQDLVISAPNANGGGKVVIIDGHWIQKNLTSTSGSTILNLANPDNLGDHVLVLSPAAASTTNEDSSQAAFGWSLAFDPKLKQLYIGAPNYARKVGPELETVPIGAVYQYKSTSQTFASGSPGSQSLSSPTVGIAGSTSTNDVSGPATKVWGAQLGASLAVSNTGKVAIGAPGVQASLLYSGTNAVEKLAAGNQNPADPYGQGALIKVMLPTAIVNTSDPSNTGLDVYVSSSDGTSNRGLVDVITNNTTKKKSALATEESTYMQALRQVQTNTIAQANVVNNPAIQTGAIGSVYLLDSGLNLTQGSLKPSNVATYGGATFYGPNAWNTGGDTDFGASLAFADISNSNTNNILAVGAPRTGGPGAVYLVNASKPFHSPTGSSTPSWIQNTNLGANQYLAYLTSGLSLYGAASSDQFGAGLVSLGDTNSDGYDDLLIQAPNASSGAGNGYVLFGKDQLIDETTPNSLLGGHNPGVGSVSSGIIGKFIFADSSSINTQILSELGHGTAALTGQGSYGSGDVNADGNNDIMLGSGTNGQAYLTWGHPYLSAIDNLQLQKLASNTGYLLDGLATTTQGSLRSIGDFNGDGYGDFISIQPGAFTDTVRIELGANTQEILADYPYNYYSFQVAHGTEVLPAGDLNGDGYSDIALFLQQNLSGADEGNAGAGSTTGILYGRPSDQLPLGSGFGLLAPVDASSAPLTPLSSQLVPGALSTKAPAMLAAGNSIYAVWVGEGTGSTNLWFAESRDGGQTWLPPSGTQNDGYEATKLSAYLPALASSTTPSLALFNDRLYIAFLDGSGKLNVSSWNPLSGDATQWSTPTVVSDGSTTFTSTLSPQLISSAGGLAITWVSADGSLASTISTSPDATIWSSVDAADGGGSSPFNPAMASDANGTVYMARVGLNNQLYWTSSSDGGQSWAGWQQLPDGMTSQDAPSLAVVNGSLYLTYLGKGNQELNITQLSDAASNSWTPQTVISNQTARTGLGAVAISETVGTTEGLAIYYAANNSTGTILRTWSATPLSASGWSGSTRLGVTSTNSNGFTTSGPLAVTRFNGSTVLAYPGGTPGSPSTTAYVATAGSSPSTSSAWATKGTLNTGNTYGIGLSCDATGVLLNTSDSGTGQQAIYRFTPPAGSGSWSPSFDTSRTTVSSGARTASLLALPSAGSSEPLLLAVADPTNGGSVLTSNRALVNNWLPQQTLLERIDTNGVVSFQPISATAAPSATLLNGTPVLAVNNNGTLNLFTGNGGKTFSLASSFNPGTSNQAGTTAPGITTTDTGLALSYRNSDGSVSLQRLNFLQPDGTPVDGVVFNADGSIDTSNADLQWQGLNLGASNGLSTALATVPLSVNGTLMLSSTSNASGSSNQLQLNAIPVLSNSGSTTWLNSTVQLSDGQGGWTLQQKAGANGAINLGPVLPDWQPIDNFNTPDAPAFVELSGVLYAITRGENEKLYINSSSDAGITWSGWSSNPNNTDSNSKSVSTTQPPTITSFGGQLYVCYIRSSDSNLMLTRYEPGTKAWGEAINIGSQTAKYLAAINQDDNLFTLFYVGSDDKLYYTSTTDPGNKGSFTGSAAIKNSSGDFQQTASGPLAAVRLNGSTYLAYQGGTSSSPSNTIYITTGPVANNNNAQNWGTFIPPGPKTSSTSKSIGLSANNLGLVLSTTDTINGQQVISLQQGTGSGTNWSFTPFSTLQQQQTSSVTQTSASLVGSPGTEAVLVASTAGINASGGNALISTQATYQPSSLALNSQQTGSSLSSVGDLDGDGYDDLVVVANNVVVQPDATTQQLATGLRLIRGAATSGSVLSINANESTSSSQSIQVATSFGLNGNTPVLALSGAPSQLALTSTSTTDGQPSELRAALLSPSLFEASSGDLNTARQLFSGNPTSGSPGLGLGFGDLSLNTTANFGDLNADGSLDYLEGNPTTVYGANGLGWHVWSIRAAGDVNGNGTDDILLSLAPPEAVLNGAPQWIQPVLVDGALFKVDKETNSFSFSAMRAPLDPYGRLQLQDLDATSSAQPWPLLQNWITPILSFQPADGSSSATISTSSPASISLPGLTGGATQQATVATAYGSSGEILLISGSMTANGFDQTGFPIIQISRVSADGTSTQWTAGIPGGVLSKANTGSTSDPHYFQLSPSGAAIFDGYLYLALSSAPYLVSGPNGEILPEDDGEMFLFSIKESDLTPDGVADASKWNQYQLPGRTSLQPALVNEEGQLALYFVSDNQYKNILVSRSSDPQDSASWDGSGKLLPWTNPNNTAGDIQINSGIASPVTPNIAATRFHTLTPAGGLDNRTYLAFCMNTNGGSGDDQVFIVEQPAEPSGTWTASQAFNAQPGNIYLSANASQLALVTTNLTGSNNPFGVTLYNTISSTPASATLQAGANATVVGASTIGGQLHLQTQSTQFFGSSIALQPVATPWTSASQKSLAGYSIDGNIDLNGDGFMDMLVSDPSDPKQNVNNQYALFGGDYLNIASQVGTPGDDVMVGTPLADVIYSIQGADQVSSNGGADVIYTGAGDDAISIKDNAFIRIDAGSGFDQLQLEGLANQSYDFRINVLNPELFAGTKLRDIELISSLDYGANTLSFDAAAINAINPDRVLFVVPDAADSIALSTEFSRNTAFDTSYGGTLWSAYAAAPASATPASSNPALVYVATPTGQTADWLSSHVSTSLTAAAAPAASRLAIAAAAPADPLDSLPKPSAIAGSQPFGDGLTLLAYRNAPASGVARFAIERRDTRTRQVVAYASSSANSSAEPGRHYSPVVGLLVLEPGESRQEVTVPIDAEAMAALRGGSLSLEVEELPDRVQKPVHLLLEPRSPASNDSAPPVLSGFTLLPDSSGEGATLRFRADSNAGTGALKSLRLSISRRRSADSSTIESSQILDILDARPGNGQPPPAYNAMPGTLALDNDQRANSQIDLQLELSFTAAAGEPSVRLAAPALAWQSSLLLADERTLQFSQDTPFTLWRADNGTTPVTFGLQGGSQSLTLLRDATGGSSGSINSQNALNSDPLTGWLASEGLAVGSRASVDGLALTGTTWTPTASRDGQQLALLGLSQEGNQITASFAEGVTAVFGLQSTGSAPTPTPIRPAVEVQRLAGYDNSLGFYALDDPITGAIGGLQPGEAGYLQRALARAEASGLLLSAKALPAYGASQVYTDLPLDPNRNYGALLLVDGDRSRLYSSFAAANPGGAPQVINLGSSSTGLVLGFEDLPATSGDNDYNDLVARITNVSVPLF